MRLRSEGPGQDVYHLGRRVVYVNLYVLKDSDFSIHDCVRLVDYPYLSTSLTSTSVVPVPDPETDVGGGSGGDDGVVGPRTAPGVLPRFPR